MDSCGDDQIWAKRRAVAVRAASRVLPGQRDAEDCAHDALVDVLVKKPDFEGVERPDAWVTTLAYRRAVDVVRQQRRAQTASFIRVLPDERLVPELADVVTERVAVQALMADLATLPEGTQAVLQQLATGRSTAEAALELGITKGAADSHLLRARRVLRERWALALSGLATVLAALRRPARSGVAVLATVPVALVLAVTQNPAAPAAATPPAAAATVAPDGPTAGPVAHRAERTAPAPGRPAQRPSAAAALATAIEPLPKAPPVARKVAAVEPAASTGVVVTHSDDGEETPPLEAVQRCLDEFVVTQQHVGC